MKIIIDNQAILKRIKEKKPNYVTRNLESERKQLEQKIANISAYPYKQYPPHKTLVQV